VTEALSAAQLHPRLQGAARRRWRHAAVLDLAPLTGGISSLTFSGRLVGAGDGADRHVVVKVAPPGLAPVGNRDVLRQARVIAALHPVPGVLVPAVLLEDEDPPPLFVMEHVPGQAYEPRWDLSDAPPAPPVVRDRALAAARMLARLHQVAPADVGLGDEPPLSPAQELERWTRLYATAGDDLRGDEQSLARALAARAPALLGPRILHGDYRLGNMQFDGARLAALIDWELWSVGDPRADLAWLMMFSDPIAQRVGDRDVANRAAAEATPSVDDLLAEYVRVAGGDAPPQLRWFSAFACYKLGAAMAVLAKRNRRAAAPDPGLERVARTTPPMLAHGMALLDGS
jgi:aminoglycoside phosphotransferase (APT) family kinase protein